MIGWPVHTRNSVIYTNCGECSEEIERNKARWFENKLLCLPCHEKVTKPLIDSFTEEYEAGECDYNKDIKCPYCGYDNESVDAFDGGEPEEWTCVECGLEFDLEVEYSYTFSSKRRD